MAIKNPNKSDKNADRHDVSHDGKHADKPRTIEDIFKELLEAQEKPEKQPEQNVLQMLMMILKLLQQMLENADKQQEKQSQKSGEGDRRRDIEPETVRTGDRSDQPGPQEIIEGVGSLAFLLNRENNPGDQAEMTPRQKALITAHHLNNIHDAKLMGLLDAMGVDSQELIRDVQKEFPFWTPGEEIPVHLQVEAGLLGSAGNAATSTGIIGGLAA